MRAIGRVGLILVALLAPVATGSAWAQTEVGGWLSGDVVPAIASAGWPSKSEQASSKSTATSSRASSSRGSGSGFPRPMRDSSSS
jgi:hypothetical protein